MSPRLRMSALRWLLAMLLALSAGAALAQSEQQKLVNAADTTFLNFMRDPEMTWLQQNIARAKGVLIAPEVVKAGFIFGGSGGRRTFLHWPPNAAFRTTAPMSHAPPGPCRKS